MIQHLLESTLFAGAVWLVTLALRHNPARTRHALWMAASIKFLLPFSLLISLGGQLGWHPAAPIPPRQMRVVLTSNASPLPYAAIAAPAAPSHRDWRPAALGVLWLGGCATLLIRWYARWRVASGRLRESAPWNRAGGLPVAVRCSGSAMEPGVIGLFRPVLLLPAGIEERLSAAQLQAVLAHELCHVRHRDNLAAALHMLVEALFWFHPLVWWMGARLVDEREQACDEEVLERGGDRVAYAESILRICQFCLESPIPCVSGITGSDLRRRIRNIVGGTMCRRLEPGKKLLLATFGTAAVTVPLAIGLLHPAEIRAQSATPLRFDVASVKLSKKAFIVFEPQRSGGRVSWTTDLTHILCYAYNVAGWRVSGPIPGADHIYEVDATTDPHAGDEQVRLMFQTLLTDRFHMAVHRVTKDLDGYALTVAKAGPKLEAAKDGDVPPLPSWFPGGAQDSAALEGKVAALITAPGIGAIAGRRADMPHLADSLQRVLKVAVLDETGLTGRYYFALQFAYGDPPADSTLPDLPVALQQFGLKLEKQKSAVEMLVVDHIESTPTEN